MSAAPTSLRITEPTRSSRLIRDALALLSSKWSVDVLLALGDGSRRYHELLGELEPISEKVLTETLRAMERDGLIHRQVHAEVPPRVDYAITPLGATLAATPRRRARRPAAPTAPARAGGPPARPCPSRARGRPRPRPRPRSRSG